MPNRNPPLFVPIEGGVAPGPLTLVHASSGQRASRKDESAPSLVPHVLQLVQPGTTDALFLSMTETEHFGADTAAVFPSFLLAQRYAEHFILKGGHTYSPVAAPDRRPTVGAIGAGCRRCGCTAMFACPDGCHWVEPDLCSACARPDPFEAWAVYRSPADFPGKSVARRYCGVVPTTDVLVADTVDDLRQQLPAGLSIVPPMEGDDRNIVEVWM